MQKVKFNMIPLLNYDEFNDVQAVNLSELVSYIKENDVLCIPQEFYTEKDINDKSFSDYMYMHGNSVMQLLLEIVSKNQIIDIGYSEIIDRCDKEEMALAGIKDNYDNKYGHKYVVCYKNEVPKIKRGYLKRYNRYEDFIERASECYPELVFHEKCFETIKLLGNYQENVEELDKNLAALNDFGAEIYQSVNGNEAEAIKKLESKCSVICSGKGSNEKRSYKIKYIQKKKIQKELKEVIELTCNPHLKLFSKHSNKRIYFCWGRKEIDNHKIIIARIGDHWK